MSRGGAGKPRGPLTHCAKWVLPPEGVTWSNRIVCRNDRGHSGAHRGAAFKRDQWVWFEWNEHGDWWMTPRTEAA